MKFHDGTPFDAEAVKVNIERGKTLQGSTLKSDLADIERRRGRQRDDRAPQAGQGQRRSAARVLHRHRPA